MPKRPRPKPETRNPKPHPGRPRLSTDPQRPRKISIDDPRWNKAERLDPQRTGNASAAIRRLIDDAEDPQ